MGRNFKPIADDAPAKPLAELLRQITITAQVTVTELAKTMHYQRSTMSQVLDGKRLSGVELYLRHVAAVRVVAKAKGTEHLIPADAEAKVRRMWGECHERVAAKASPFEAALDTVMRHIKQEPAAGELVVDVDSPGSAAADSGAEPPWTGTPTSLGAATTMAEVIEALRVLKARNGFDLTKPNRRRHVISDDLTPELLAAVLEGTARPTPSRVIQIAAACGDTDAAAWRNACDRVVDASLSDVDQPARFRFYAGHVVPMKAPNHDLSSRRWDDLVPAPAVAVGAAADGAGEGRPPRPRWLRRGAHRAD
jgi:hypothetical protein